MREIKFRAWQIEEKEMLEDVCTNTDDFTDMLNDTFKMWDRDGEIILMQFTGLHDKNGKEIYEGDIVDHCDWKIDSQYDKPKNHTNRAVAWSEIKCMWKFADDSKDLWNISTYSNMKIIGNIHENPELLKSIS